MTQYAQKIQIEKNPNRKDKKSSAETDLQLHYHWIFWFISYFIFVKNKSILF